jgi:hypothetical protein
MSLQTPRVLTADDVALLRGPTTAAEAYRAAVDEVPAAARARAEAAEAAKTDGTLRFANPRRPFAMLDRLPAAQKKQLKQLATQNLAGKLEKLVDDPDWNPMELVDVLDVATGDVTHQLYLWPYGAGEIFEHDTTTSTARIVQHDYQVTPGDLPFRKALAAAYANASPPPSEVVDFRLDHDPPPVQGSEKDRVAAMKQLGKSLPHYPSGAVLFETLTEAQRARVLTAIRSSAGEQLHGVGWLGLVTGDSTKRWAGLAPPGLLETRVGKWPVWKWLCAAAHGEVTTPEAIGALIGALSPAQIAEVCLLVSANDDYALFESAHKYSRGETVANAYTVHTLRFLGALLDASGDDAALAFARGASAQVAQPLTTFALVARAKRRGETFPDEFFELACASASPSLASAGGLREVVECLSPALRLAFYEKDRFSDTWNEDRKGTRAVETPTPMGAWWYADLLPAETVAEAVVAAIVAWNHQPKPKRHALDLIATIGPACVPFLDRALAASEPPPHRAVLVAARKLFDDGTPKTRKS